MDTIIATRYDLRKKAPRLSDQKIVINATKIRKLKESRGKDVEKSSA